jgi:ribonucleoside-diphosphate reductase alpha chain
MERSLGIGVMGFHSYLQEEGVPYESAMAHAINLRLFKWLKGTGDRINTEVALERGSCPDAIHAGLIQRWSHMFSVAPTASISIICGETSASVEPRPSNLYIAKTLSGSFEVRCAALERLILKHAQDWYLTGDPDMTFDRQSYIDDFVSRAWKQIENDDGSCLNLAFLSDDEKDTFKTFLEVDQRWVIGHAAARAPFIDQMASNNISVRPDVHKRDLHNLHMKAWRDGVPSLYYLRSKSMKRGGKIAHVAGELPQPRPPHDVTLIDRGEAVEPLADIAYDECLSCQ